MDRRTFCPSGPVRSGQDNQEPIYDNSRVKIGADVGDPGTVSMQDIEEGHSYGKKKPRLQSRIQRHLDTALAITGGTGKLLQRNSFSNYKGIRR